MARNSTTYVDTLEAFVVLGYLSLLGQPGNLSKITAGEVKKADSIGKQEALRGKKRKNDEQFYY